MEIQQVMSIVQKHIRQWGKVPSTSIQFYRVGKMLGRGAFGRVSLGMHKMVRKLVAMKTLNRD